MFRLNFGSSTRLLQGLNKKKQKSYRAIIGSKNSLPEDSRHALPRYLANHEIREKFSNSQGNRSRSKFEPIAEVEISDSTEDTSSLQQTDQTSDRVSSFSTHNTSSHQYQLITPYKLVPDNYESLTDRPKEIPLYSQPIKSNTLRDNSRLVMGTTMTETSDESPKHDMFANAPRLPKRLGIDLDSETTYESIKRIVGVSNADNNV